jgi:hypothetical protein
LIDHDSGLVVELELHRAVLCGFSCGQCKALITEFAVISSQEALSPGLI